MSAHLGDSDVRRIAHAGVVPMAAEDGLALFDAACAGDRAFAVAARLAPTESGGPGVASRADTASPLLRGLVRTPVRRITETVPGGSGGPGVAPGADAASLRDRLARLPDAEQGKLLLDLVRTEIAAVLGHSSPDAVDTDRAFRDLGFDSLTAVELRNRLGAATGLRLPVTTVFDYPAAAALADYLRVELVGAPTSLADELDRIEVALSRLGRDDDTLGTATARLAALLDRYGAVPEATRGLGPPAGDHDHSAAGPLEPGGVAEAFASATDDELFTFIDDHF
jgi:acyl carrier protein